MYSIDIAKERLDEQDKKIVSHVIKNEWKNKRCLILGSGEGRIGIVLALLGFEIVCIDINDYSDFYKNVNKLFNLKKPITFIKRDLSEFSAKELEGEFALVLVQRVLHYMKYKQIKTLLDELPKIMTKRGCLYVAVSCMDSAMGIGYQGASYDIQDRYHELSSEMKERFSLTVPVCLFSLQEFKGLMKGTYFKKKHLYQTSFGNIKACYKL